MTGSDESDIFASYRVVCFISPEKNRSRSSLEAKPLLRVLIKETLQTEDADAVYYATFLRGASNVKAKCELGFQPRSLQWLVDSLFDVF
jgi:hypothetical protein